MEAVVEAAVVEAGAVEAVVALTAGQHWSLHIAQVGCLCRLVDVFSNRITVTLPSSLASLTHAAAFF